MNFSALMSPLSNSDFWQKDTFCSASSCTSSWCLQDGSCGRLDSRQPGALGGYDLVPGVYPIRQKYDSERLDIPFNTVYHRCRRLLPCHYDNSKSLKETLIITSVTLVMMSSFPLLANVMTVVFPSLLLGIICRLRILSIILLDVAKVDITLPDCNTYHDSTRSVIKKLVYVILQS